MAKMVFELSKEEFRTIVRGLHQGRLGKVSWVLEVNEIVGVLQELMIRLVNKGQLYIRYDYELRIDGASIPLDYPHSGEKLEKLVREQLDS